MSYFYGRGIIIEVERDETTAPVTFTWEGKTYPVEEIIIRWRVDEGWRTGDRQWREYFRLVTTTGYLVEIYHDLVKRNWRIQRLYD